MLQDLIYIADRLDKSGFYRNANSIDSIIKKIAELNSEETSSEETSEETVIFDEEDSDMTQILVSDNPKKPSWKEYGARFGVEGIRGSIIDLFGKINWAKLGEDWVGPEPDPLINHRDRVINIIKAIEREEAEGSDRTDQLREDELKEYFYFINYLDLPQDIEGWNTMTPEERKALIGKQKHLQKTILNLVDIFKEQ